MLTNVGILPPNFRFQLKAMQFACLFCYTFATTSGVKAKLNGITPLGDVSPHVEASIEPDIASFLPGYYSICVL